MKTTRRFCPSVCPLEGRLALSFSFSSMLHSILPFIPDHSAAAKPKGPTNPAPVARLHPAHHAAIPHAAGHLAHAHAHGHAHAAPVRNARLR